MKYYRKTMKPLGHKSYGSIPHLPGSKLGPGDHHCHEGQERIATVKTRDQRDVVIVQEKVDGGNVGVAKVDGKILALTRAGYLASSSPYETHHEFERWVMQNRNRFKDLLREGERVCGEWMYHAVGTRYHLPHEPFVAFDIMAGTNRENFYTVLERLRPFNFIPAYAIHVGAAISVEQALRLMPSRGHHGAVDPVEGLIYRIERNGVVDFLCKYVNANHQTGRYLPEISGKPYRVNPQVDVLFPYIPVMKGSGLLNPLDDLLKKGSF